MYNPNYTITDRLLSKIAEIESYRTKVDSSYILPEREIGMRYRATVEAAHSSTSIEGNPLGIKQVEQVLAASEQLTRHQYAEIEVKNYKRALDFINKRKDVEKSISLRDILAIHKIIMNDLLPAGKVGALRENPIFITNQDDNIEYTGPEAKNLIAEVDALLAWLEGASDIHPVIASAILHLQLISIHPFADGNGRTTRVLTSLYLGLRGYDFRGSLVLDSYYSADKLEYYRALSLSDNYLGRKNTNLNPWIDYFTDGFLSSARLLSAEVAILSSVVKPAEQQRISSDEADLLGFARQFGSISLSEAKGIVAGASERTIQRKLKKLVDEGYLEMSGNARDARYIWKEAKS